MWGRRCRWAWLGAYLDLRTGSRPRDRLPYFLRRLPSFLCLPRLRARWTLRLCLAERFFLVAVCFTTAGGDSEGKAIAGIATSGSVEGRTIGLEYTGVVKVWSDP